MCWDKFAPKNVFEKNSMSQIIVSIVMFSFSKRQAEDHTRVMNCLPRPIASTGKIYLRSAQFLQLSQHFLEQSRSEHLSLISNTAPLWFVWALKLISLFAASFRYLMERKVKMSCENPCS